MSWSINLNGPKNVVQRELADAMLLFDKAFDWVENADEENTLSVNLSGYVSWNEDGVTCSSVGFTVGESVPEKHRTSSE